MWNVHGIGKHDSHCDVCNGGTHYPYRRSPTTSADRCKRKREGIRPRSLAFPAICIFKEERHVKETVPYGNIKYRNIVYQDICAYCVINDEIYLIFNNAVNNEEREIH